MNHPFPSKPKARLVTLRPVMRAETAQYFLTERVDVVETFDLEGTIGQGDFLTGPLRSPCYVDLMGITQRKALVDAGLVDLGEMFYQARITKIWLVDDRHCHSFEVAPCRMTGQTSHFRLKAEIAGETRRLHVAIKHDSNQTTGTVTFEIEAATLDEVPIPVGHLGLEIEADIHTNQPES